MHAALMDWWMVLIDFNSNTTWFIVYNYLWLLWLQFQLDAEWFCKKGQTRMNRLLGKKHIISTQLEKFSNGPSHHLLLFTLKAAGNFLMDKNKSLG